MQGLASRYDFDKLPDDMKAINQILNVNRHLVYLDVLMLTDHHKHGTALKKQHLKPLDRPARLSRKVKLAFLSVVSARTAEAAAPRNKRSRPASRSDAGAAGLDQRMVSQIFSFAGAPLLRRVYFRTTKRYLEPYWDDFFDEEEDFDDDEDADGA